MPPTVTGIKPTGRAHLGNYIGMIRPARQLAGTGELLCFIADYHALNVTPPPAQVRRGVLDLAATLIAFGLDTEQTVLYRQSDLPEVTELAWILGCRGAKGLLNRAHAYKAATAANAALGREADHGVNMGLFGYPLLMAADILIHGGAVVPVGPDQRQHLEITRNLAESFNRAYGPVLTPPEPVIDAAAVAIPGIDGRKMSKSYGNQIALTASADEIRRAVSRIVTDSRPVAEPKQPDTILALYQCVAPGPAALELQRRYLAGGVSYAEAKSLLAEAIDRLLAEGRGRYAELMADPASLEDALTRGAARARASAAPTLRAVREATGLGRG